MSKPSITQRITFTCEISGYDAGISDGDFQKHLEICLHDWSNGRYPLDVELIQKGIAEVAKRAVWEVVYAQLREKHGAERVESKDGLTSSLLAHILTPVVTQHVGFSVGECSVTGVETVNRMAGDDRYEFPEIEEEDYRSATHP